MHDLLQTIPVELVEKILSLIDSSQDLRSLSLSARYVYHTAKRHADYRHIRCSLTQGEATWEVLAADKPLAANVRILEIQPETSNAPLKAMLLPAALFTPPAWNSSHYTRRAESSLIAALPNLVNLDIFRWDSDTPTIGEIYDPDIGDMLRQYGLEEEVDDVRYGEEMWYSLATLKMLRHVEISDNRRVIRFPFDTSPLWTLRGLTTFTFTANWDEDQAYGDPFDLLELGKMLGVGCPALESLDVTSNVYKNYRTCEDITPPEESRGDLFLGPYVWPHLHTLRLSGIGCSSANARIFLQNHPGIETLDISRHFGLNIDDVEEKYTGSDHTPYPLDTLPNLRWLTAADSEQAIHILSSPTTFPRPFKQLSDICATGNITALSVLPYLTRLDFKKCILNDLIDMISNTTLLAQLQWLDVGRWRLPCGDDWFSTTRLLIPTLAAFPNLVAFHGIELIRTDGPLAQNGTIAADLLRTCPKLRRIDIWRRHSGDAAWFRFNDKGVYIALNRNDVGMATWKICKIDEWRAGSGDGDDYSTLSA